MKVKYILNNYQIGAKLKTAPVDCVISNNRLDDKHTKVIFDINERQKDFCDKLFAGKGEII